MPRRVGLGLLLVAVSVFCIGRFPAVIVAQEQLAVELQANEAQHEFPRELSFHLEATASSPVEMVELEYGVDKVSCEGGSVRIVPDLTKDDLQPEHIYADWTWDFRRSGSLPPGARIWWRWHLTAETGGSWASSPAWVTFDDDRYDWQTADHGQIAVHWYEGDQDFGLQMLQAAVDAQARLTADPGANLEQPVHLYLYATADDLQDALVFSQRWTGGIAFPDYYTILIAVGPRDLAYGRRTVAHELMHLVVHQLAFNCWSDLPRWLDEGLASWAEGDLDPEQQRALEEAIAEDGLLSLRSLSTSFSAQASRANLSYAQSYSVVAFLIEEYGRERILELLAVFRVGASYDSALVQIYGFDTDTLEDLWRASVGAQARPTATAPAGTPTPVPTLVLWGSEPTDQTATSSPSPPPPFPSPSSEPTATSTPLPTTVAAEASSPPGATVDRFAGPTPMSAAGEETKADNGIWYVVGGGAVLTVLSIVVLVGVYLRRR